MATTHSRMTAEDRHDQLLDVALALFSQQGYDATSTRDIAAAAGVTDGLIYKYFTSKEELLAGVIERAIHRLELLTLPEEYSACPEVALAEMLVCLGAYMRQGLPLIDLCLFEMRRNTAAAQQFEVLRSVSVDRLAGLLAAWHQQGILRVEDPQRSARLLSGSTLIFTLASREWLEEEWKAELQALTANSARVFVQGTLPR